MRLVYIIGPYRALNAWLIEANIRRAEEAALLVAKCGAVPVCPHTMYRFFQGTLPDDFWLEATMDLLRACEAVAITGRWNDSEGSRAEMGEAERIGLPHFWVDNEASLGKLVEWAFTPEISAVEGPAT